CWAWGWWGSSRPSRAPARASGPRAARGCSPWSGSSSTAARTSRWSRRSAPPPPERHAMKTLVLIVLAALVGTARAAPGEPRPASEIAALLAGAEPGATVRVPPGVYRGPLAIDRPVRLEGGGRVTIDGGGQGDVVVITAGGVEMRGFTIRGTGHQLYQEN